MKESLKKLGFSEKEVDVYITCLQLGPSSVRKIADNAGINRGTTYDILKSLQNSGLVSYYHKEKRQYFIAEDPENLRDTLDAKQQQLEKAKQEVDSVIPRLRSLYDNAGDKPVTKYYEGKSGIKTILRDVIESCQNGSKEYYIYSSSKIKQHVYDSYRNFTKDRIKAGVSVKSISIGAGGSTAGLDERKWLTKKGGSPTYTLMYEGKIAMVSVDSENKLIGVIVEDENMYKTQKMIFEFVWQKL